METEKKHERMFSDLTTEEQAAIKQLAFSKEPIRVEVVDEWTDDHLPCIGAEVNGVPMGFWWLSSHGVGALTYADDSKKAQTRVRKMLRSQVEMWDEEQAEEKKNG